MDRIALFVDNAEHARALLHSLLKTGPVPTQVVLVACPPRLTRRIGKWVSHRNRESWRASWSQKLFGELAPMFVNLRDTQVITEIGHAPLPTMAAALRRTYGSDMKLFDARRPKMGQPLEPIQDGVPTLPTRPIATPIAITSSICAVLALTD